MRLSLFDRFAISIVFIFAFEAEEINVVEGSQNPPAGFSQVVHTTNTEAEARAENSQRV